MAELDKRTEKRIQCENKIDERDKKNEWKWQVRKNRIDVANTERAERKNFVNSLGMIFGIILALLLIRIIVNLESENFVLPTFNDIIDLINDVPLITIPTLDTTSWGSVPLIGEALAVFGTVLNAFLFLANGVLRIVNFAWNIIKWLFLLG